MSFQNKNIDHFTFRKTMWAFIRGDCSVKEFESWVYDSEDLESFLYPPFYLDIISADFSDKNAIYYMKCRLLKLMRASYSNHCRCIEISEDAVIDMGVEGDEFFKHLEEVKRRGVPYWWLSVYKCRDCSAVWLVGADERQNDIYCLSRVDETVLDGIVNSNKWPQTFETYEDILLRGLEAEKSVRFIDLIGSSPLLQTIYDLMGERPDILVSEIAKLLNLDLETAMLLFEMVEKEKRYRDGVC